MHILAILAAITCIILVVKFWRLILPGVLIMLALAILWLGGLSMIAQRDVASRQVAEKPESECVRSHRLAQTDPTSSVSRALAVIACVK